MCTDERPPRIRLGVFDIDGVLRGKYVSKKKFEAAAENGLGFCDVIFGWDLADELCSNIRYTGWHTGYPDLQARIDTSSKRSVPWESNTDLYLLDLYCANGQPLPISPRNVLRHVIEHTRSLGFEACFGVEYEFWFFAETPQSVRAKGFNQLNNLSPGMLGYSILRTSQQSALIRDLLEYMAAYDIELEGLHTETGPGVYEAAITADTALAAADKAALFKTATKEIAARHGLIATFMAKWNTRLPGSSGHLHQSLWAKDSKTNLFVSEPFMRSYIEGILDHMIELTAIFCPTINSYKRLAPGTWAPVNASWGFDNRTTAIRALPGSVKTSRIELRLCGADINPHLAIAASLAAGTDGVIRGLTAREPSQNGYASDGPELPRTLRDATELFKTSRFAMEWLGSEFVRHYTETREWEWRQFERSVTNWELERYLESV
jgi:glutamine synthetase